MTEKKQVLLEVKDMCKNFGATVALNHVDLTLQAGEIRGLIGENGSGKSTVSSIAAGMQKATSGEMFYLGEPWSPNSMLEAQQKGICMIVQEKGTIPNITVAENIFLGHADMFKSGMFISMAKMIAEAQKILDDLGIEIKADEKTYKLDIEQCKLVEIAKAMFWKPKIFIVDETTTALSQKGRELLYKLMHRLSAEGTGVMFISHDLDELIAQCDAVTVLRDGKIIGSLNRDEMEPGHMKQMMVGREVTDHYYRSDEDPYGEEVVLKADYLTTRRDLLCFNLELHKGEILGIGGLSECGMHTVGKALFGAANVIDGEIIKTGKKPVKITDPATAIVNGIAYTSKDRDNESLGLNSPIAENIASTGYEENKVLGPIISYKKEKNYVEKQIDSLSIKCNSEYQYVNTLSGGNKQKVVFGKWMGMDPDIMILDCPTRGIDIGVKVSMYQLIYEMKKQGKSIVLISEELPELIGMSDRILIMKDGAVVHEALRSEHPTEQQLVEYMI